MEEDLIFAQIEALMQKSFIAVGEDEHGIYIVVKKYM